MWINNRIIEEDLEYNINCEFIPWDKLKDKTVFITGTTGLIGRNLVNSLLYANIKKGLNIKVLGLVRDLNKAKTIFMPQLRDAKGLEFIEGDVRTFTIPDCPIDYIIHGASITSSKDMLNNPKEVISINVEGTNHIIDLANTKNVKSILYLSSMEVYGQSSKGHVIKEEDHWYFDENDPRSSYPISKQKCEELLLKFNKKTNNLVKIARLAQTFGPGLKDDDNRVFSYFAKCIMNKEDIILKTKGESERCYNYTIDAIAALLTILLDESKETTYNVANNNTYSSIKDIANKISKDKVNVIFDISDNKQYPKDSYLLLDSSKLISLGFKFKYNNFFERYIEYLTIRDNPLISIIVPVYNVEKYLRRCLDSLVNQTYKNIEIIVVDDGSTDSSGEICDEYQRKYTNIIVYHKSNGGISDARNYGIKHSKGEYISFVDSDDYVSNDYIDYLFYLTKRYTTCISTALYTRANNPTFDFNKEYIEGVFTKGDALKECCLGDKVRAISCCKLFKSNIFDVYLFPINKLYEDQFIIYKIVDSVLSISYSSKHIYSYTINPNSITLKDFSDKQLDMIDASCQLIEYTKDMNENIKFAVNYRCVISLFQIIKLFFKSNNNKQIFNTMRNRLRTQLKSVLLNNKYYFKIRIIALLILMGYFPTKLMFIFKK